MKTLLTLATLVVLAAASSAAVVDSGLVNLATNNGGAGSYLNFITGGYSSPPASTFPVVGESGFNWDLNIYGTSPSLYLCGSTTAGHSTTQANTGYGVVSDTTSGAALALTPGAVVGSSSTFSTSGTSTNIGGGVTKYFGIRFWNEGADLTTATDDTILYGYVQVRLTTGASTATTNTSGFIERYVYDNAPGTSITVQAVPEPATFATLGLGAVAMLRRRKRA